MKKPTIDAKEALEDIRSGLDDSFLMKKYNLSEKGLESLFKKLADAGFLNYLNARGLLEDMISGVDEKRIQEKYELSPKGYTNIVKELERTGLISLAHKQNITSSRITINAQEIATDIREGISSSTLMEKYGLTNRGFQWVCLKLIAGGILSVDEISPELVSDSGSFVIDAVRASDRYVVTIESSIFELQGTKDGGKIIDVSEGGLRISGLEVEVDEIKTLVIPKDLYGEFGQIVFDAKCRWVNTSSNGSHLAGFEIVQIAQGMKEEYQLFMKSRAKQKSHNK